MPDQDDTRPTPQGEHTYTLTDRERRIIARALDLSALATLTGDNPSNPITQLRDRFAPDGIEALGCRS